MIENVYLKIELSSVTTAFCEFPRKEVCRILANVKARIQSDQTEGDLFDLNGNKVGTWILDIEDSGNTY